MKYQVRIENHIYNVEVKDINTRPVQVNVDGETFEIWPEIPTAEPKTSPAAGAANEHAAAPPPAPIPSPAAASAIAEKARPPDQTKTLRAPIPGIILRIAVQPGTEVEYGQELCVLEAMKMNNLIRAPRAGTISAVHVSEGKHVKHGDLLMEFA